nr:hypothetical protein [Tanacetum cinerariifolium]
MPPKPDLVFHTAPIVIETDHSAFTVQLSPTKPTQDLSHTTRPMAPIIKDWVSDLEDKSELNDPQSVPSFVQTSEHVKPFRHYVQPIETPILTATPKPTSPTTNSSGKRKNRKTFFTCKSVCVHQRCKTYVRLGLVVVVYRRDNDEKPCINNNDSRPVSADVPKIMLTRPRHAHSLNTKSNLTIRRHKTRSQSSKTSNSSLKVTTAKAQVVSAAKGKKGNGGCSRNMTGNMSYLCDFQKLNGGYVSFGGNPKGGKISGKGKIKIDFKLPDESQVLLRVPRENNMYNVNLKDLVPSGDLTCLFAKATIDESNLWHRRLGHINFKTINKLVKATKDETSPILKTCITGLENQLSLKVKVIRSDNGSEFINSDINPFLNTACYVQNRVLVTKPHNKMPYELLHGRTPSIGFMRPFGCPATILNTLDPLGKFKGKVDEGFLVGYSINSKAFRVFNSRTHIVQETLHVYFLENKPNIAGTGPTWLFDIDSLTRTMNYQPVTAGNQSNLSAGDDAFDGKEHDAEKLESAVNLSPSSSALSSEQDDKTKKKDKGKSHVEYFTGNRDLNVDFKDYSEDRSNDVSAAGPIVPTGGQNYSNSINPISAAGPSNSNTSSTHGKSLLKDASEPPKMLEREDIAYSDIENVGAEDDFNNLETSIIVSPIPTRIHKDHPVSQIIGNLSSTTQTRSMTRVIKDQAMQEELIEFKMQKVWILVDLPHRKRAIGTKWVYINKKDERGIVVRNKARHVAQGNIQEEGIDYEEVFAPVARIEAVRLFLAYASFTGFMVYQMDVKSAFLYETIKEEVYVCKPSGFEDPDHPDKVYKVVKALYGLHQAPRAWYETLVNYLLENGFHRGNIDQTLFIKKQKGDILLVHIYVDDIIFGVTKKELCKSFEKLMKNKFQMSLMGELTFFLGLLVMQKKDGIFISQDKYVAEILKKFGLTKGKSASTPIDTEKPLLKDPDGEDVNVHIYSTLHKQSLLDLAALFFSAALSNSSIQQHQLLPGSTKIFTSSSKHLVFFFKLHGSIYSKANSGKCQPMDQNIDFSNSDQIQTPQYPDIHPPSQEISDEVFQAKGDLMKSIEFFLEEFNYIPFGEKPNILLEAWYNFFTIRHAQSEDSNELFQKLLEDLKELVEYKEYLENSSCNAPLRKEDVMS